MEARQPDLFDVEECVKSNQKLKRTEYYNSVELPWFDKPQDDNQRMLNLQYQFLKNGDMKARAELFELVYKVMQRILWRKMKKGGLKYLDKEAQAEIVSDAFEYVCRRFDSGTGYVVTKNFISVCKEGVRHSLNYTTMKDSEVSLDAFEKDWTWKAKGIYS